MTTNAAKPSITTRTRLTFGLGGVAEGIVSNGMSFFLLVYYNQVLGLPAHLTGLALSLSLFVDAISDPVIGYASDHTNSRMGRRHPYIYAGLIPAAVFYALLWFPDSFGSSESDLFLHLCVCTVLLRLFTTLYNVPLFSLIPDISNCYDERIRITSYIIGFQWFSGIAISIAMYTLWLVPTEQYAEGIYNKEGYQTSGMVGGAIVFAALFACALGLHKFIPHLAKPNQGTTQKVSFRSQMNTLISNSSYRALVGTLVFYGTASALTFSLWTYVFTFFWGFNSEQISLIVAAQLIAAAVSVLVVPYFTQGKDKAQVFINVAIIAVSITTIPIVLKLSGLMPKSGSESLFSIILIVGFLEVVFSIFLYVLLSAMLSDLTEDIQIKINKRLEGTIYSTQIFIGKISMALGVSIAGFIITAADFPSDGSAAKDISLSHINTLGISYGPVYALLIFGGLLFIRKYNITRHTHLTNIEALASNEI